MIDGYKGNRDLLDSKEVVLSCPHNIPEILGMKKLSEPVVYRAESNKEPMKSVGGYTALWNKENLIPSTLAIKVREMLGV